MRTIYTDSKNQCHVSDDGKMVAVEVDHFNGKCDFFVEGHCCTVDENSVIIWPWKDVNELDAAQAQYEADLAAAAAAYQEGVNAAYDQ